MNIHHCGLHYDEIRRNIELSTYGVFAEPDAAYSPEWLHSFLSERMRLKKAWLDRDILASINNKGRVSGIYHVQNGAQTYGLFSQRLTLLYALLSFREAFVFVHYKADASGKPGKRDDEVCRILSRLFSSLQLTLYDFLLIGSDGFYSYRTHGRLDPAHTADIFTSITSTTGDRAA